jgi:hypothetical protein
MAPWLIITGFELDLLTPSFTISLNHNQLKQLTINDFLRLSPFWLNHDCLLWLTWFRFTDELVLGSPFYCDCFGSYLVARLYSVAVSEEISVACSDPWTRLLISQQRLISKRLHLLFPYPWTGLFNTQRCLCPRTVSPRKRVHYPVF